MNFYYNLPLNLNDYLYEFYEWENNEILIVQKIPIFRVKTKVLKDFYLYNIKIEDKFLKKIFNKCVCKEKVNYLAVFTDTKNTLAIEFKDTGESLFKSKLDLNNDLTICELSLNMEIENINYEKSNKTYKYHLNLRKDEQEKKIVLKEIENLYNSNNLEKLKYLYYELSDIICDNIKEIYNKLLNLLETNDENINYIYKIIKLSYKKEH